VDTLVELGFTQLEADIYMHLLQEAPVTGYRVARSLGKPAANVYQALESLQGKGAIMVDEGRTRICRPVPHGELLDRLERDFRSRRRRVEAELSRLHRATSDDRVYAIHDQSQVYERARRMIAGSRAVVVADAFPEPMTVLRDSFAEAAARGVRVAVKAYVPAEIDGVDVTLPADREHVLAAWPGQQLNMVVDAQEHLLALLDRRGEEVLQAVWSGSTYLSCLTHSWLAVEVCFSELVDGLRAGKSTDSLAATADRLHGIIHSHYPGYETLVRRYGERTESGGTES